jgi:opacity protein-like surface antigen
MKRLTAGWLILGLIAMAAPVSAQSYRLSGFGAKLGYTTPENLDGTMMVGGHLEFERSGSRVHILPSVMYWNVNDVRDVNPNVDLYYHFEPEGAVSPYLGAGLGMNLVSDDRPSRPNHNDLGANLFGGLRFPAAASHAFVEGRYTVADISQFAIMGGFTLHNR